MASTASEITDIIKAQIKEFEGHAESADVGTVGEIGDGIARIYGLAGCMASELLDFGNEVFGLAFNLEEDTVSAIILGDYTGIEEGGVVRTTGRIVQTGGGPQRGGRRRPRATADARGGRGRGRGPSRAPPSSPPPRPPPPPGKRATSSRRSS